MPDKKFLGDVYRERSDDETRTLYEQWSESYDDEVMGYAYAQPARCAAALSSLLDPEGARILDVGCGTGLAGRALAEAGYRHVDGCDFSAAMLRRAAATGAYRHLFEANLNAPPLAVADAHYDAATCVGVFSFGHVAPAAMDEILRVTAPGGPIIVGLNELYYEKGELTARLEKLRRDGALEILGQDKGDHLPGHGMSGWVIRLRKSGLTHPAART